MGGTKVPWGGAKVPWGGLISRYTCTSCYWGVWLTVLLYFIFSVEVTLRGEVGGVDVLLVPYSDHVVSLPRSYDLHR